MATESMNDNVWDKFRNQGAFNAGRLSTAEARELQDHNLELQAEVQNLHAQIADLMQQLTAHKDFIEVVKQEAAKADALYYQHVKEFEDRQASTANEVIQLKGQLQQKEAKIAAMQEEMDANKQHHDQQRNQLIALKAHLDSVERELATVQAAYQESTEELRGAIERQEASEKQMAQLLEKADNDKQRRQADLADMKRREGEAKRLAKRAEQQAADAAARSAAVEELRSKVNKQLAELDEQQAALESREDALAKAEVNLKKEQQQHADRQATLHSQEASLTEREAQLQSRRDALALAEAAAKLSSQALSQRESDLQQREHAQRDHQQQLDEQEVTLNLSAQQMEVAVQTLEAEQQKIQQEQAQLLRDQAKLQASQSELHKEREELLQQEQAAGKQKQVQQDYERQLQETREALEDAKAAIRLEHDYSGCIAQLETEKVELQNSLASMQMHLQESKNATAKLQQQLQAAEARASAKLQQELAAVEASVSERLQQQLEAAEARRLAKLQQQLEAAEAQAAAAASIQQQLQDEVEKLRKHETDIQSTVQKHNATEQRLEAWQQRLDASHAELVERQQRVAHLEQCNAAPMRSPVAAPAMAPEQRAANVGADVELRLASHGAAAEPTPQVYASRVRPSIKDFVQGLCTLVSSPALAINPEQEHALTPLPAVRAEPLPHDQAPPPAQHPQAAGRVHVARRRRQLSVSNIQVPGAAAEQQQLQPDIQPMTNPTHVSGNAMKDNVPQTQPVEALMADAQLVEQALNADQVTMTELPRPHQQKKRKVREQAAGDEPASKRKHTQHTAPSGNDQECGDQQVRVESAHQRGSSQAPGIDDAQGNEEVPATVATDGGSIAEAAPNGQVTAETATPHTAHAVDYDGDGADRGQNIVKAGQGATDQAPRRRSTRAAAKRGTGADVQQSSDGHDEDASRLISGSRRSKPSVSERVVSDTPAALPTIDEHLELGQNAYVSLFQVGSQAPRQVRRTGRTTSAGRNSAPTTSVSLRSQSTRNRRRAAQQSDSGEVQQEAPSQQQQQGHDRKGSGTGSGTRKSGSKPSRALQGLGVTAEEVEEILCADEEEHEKKKRHWRRTTTGTLRVDPDVLKQAVDQPLPQDSAETQTTSPRLRRSTRAHKRA